MRKTKHTIGPWEVEYSETGYPDHIIAPKASDHVPGAVGRRVTRSRTLMLPSSREALANIKLMAAAPSLLDALEQCVNFIQRDKRRRELGNHEFVMATLAIERAKK